MSQGVKYVTSVRLEASNAASEASSRSRSSNRKQGDGEGGGGGGEGARGGGDSPRLGLPPRSAAGRSLSPSPATLAARSKSPMRIALPTRRPTPPKDTPPTTPTMSLSSPRPLRAARHLSPSKFGSGERESPQREAVPKPSAIFSRNLAQSRYATQPSSAPNSPMSAPRGLPRFNIHKADDDRDDRSRYDRSASIGVVVPHRASVVLSRSPSPSPSSVKRRSSTKVSKMADKLSERLVSLSPSGTRKYEKSDGSSPASHSPSVTRKTQSSSSASTSASGYGGIRIGSSAASHSSSNSPSGTRKKPGSGRTRTEKMEHATLDADDGLFCPKSFCSFPGTMTGQREQLLLQVIFPYK